MKLRRHLVLLVITGAVASASLSGCAMAAAPDGSTASPTHDATQSPTPAPTPTPTAPPSLDELTLSPDGLGDIRFGAPVPDMSEAAAIVMWQPTGCLEPGESGTGAPGEGKWASTYPLAPSGRQLQPEAFRIGTSDETKDADVVAMQVFSPSIRTAEDIGLGSTADDIRAAYPGISETTGNTSTIFSLTGTGTNRLDLEIPLPDYPDGGDEVVVVSASDGQYPPSSNFAGDGSVDCRGAA